MRRNALGSSHYGSRPDGFVSLLCILAACPIDAWPSKVVGAVFVLDEITDLSDRGGCKVRRVGPHVSDQTNRVT